MTDTRYPYVWWWRVRLPDRKGHPCRVLVRGRRNSALVEFRDGYLVVTSRFAVRKSGDDRWETKRKNQ